MTNATSPFENIIQIQSKIEGLKKDTNNPFFKSKYMNLGDIVNKLKPIIHSHNCYPTHEVIEEDGKSKLWSKICYKDGTVLLQCKTPLLSKDPSDPQKFGSAITYMRRYNLTAMLEIEEDDDDGNGAAKGDKTDQQKLSNVSDKDMKETLAKQNEKIFSAIKDQIEDCGSVAELNALIQREKPQIARLHKYAKHLFVMLQESKQAMIEELDPEGVEAQG